MSETSPPILCPFLEMASPDTSSRRGFVRDCRTHGMGRWMALFVVLQVTSKQKGWFAALRGETPDLYALDNVPGVSHTDLYGSYLPQLRAQREQREDDGQLTLQDLVEMKEWVARQEQVEIIESSRIETALLFVRAGGDLDTGKVATADVFELLEGRSPSVDAGVTGSTLSKAQKMTSWT